MVEISKIGPDLLLLKLLWLNCDQVRRSRRAINFLEGHGYLDFILVIENVDAVHCIAAGNANPERAAVKRHAAGDRLSGCAPCQRGNSDALRGNQSENSAVPVGQHGYVRTVASYNHLVCRKGPDPEVEEMVAVAYVGGAVGRRKIRR